MPEAVFDAAGERKNREERMKTKKGGANRKSQGEGKGAGINGGEKRLEEETGEAERTIIKLSI